MTSSCWSGPRTWAVHRTTTPTRLQVRRPLGVSTRSPSRRTRTSSEDLFAAGRDPRLLRRCAGKLRESGRHILTDAEVKSATWTRGERRSPLQTSAGPVHRRECSSAAWGPLTEPCMPDVPWASSGFEGQDHALRPLGSRPRPHRPAHGVNRNGRHRAIDSVRAPIQGRVDRSTSSSAPRPGSCPHSGRPIGPRERHPVPLLCRPAQRLVPEPGVLRARSYSCSAP